MNEIDKCLKHYDNIKSFFMKTIKEEKSNDRKETKVDKLKRLKKRKSRLDT